VRRAAILRKRKIFVHSSTIQPRARAAVLGGWGAGGVSYIRQNVVSHYHLPADNETRHVKTSILVISNGQSCTE
jgi:hypothetical protein